MGLLAEKKKNCCSEHLSNFSTLNPTFQAARRLLPFHTMADTAVSLSDAQIDELLNQAESRLLEKQQSQKSKSDSALQISNKNVASKNNKTAIAPASVPATPTANNQKGQELTVRVPEVRKSKKEMVCPV